MSLTSLIKSNPSIKKSFPMLKKHLENLHDSKLDTTDWKKEIKVPSIGSSFEKGLIGTAFDYVIRAVVAQKIANKSHLTMEDLLIAEIGLESFAFSCKNESPIFFPTKDPVINKERIKGYKVIYKDSKKIIKYLEKELELALRIRKDFIKGKENLDELIVSSIFLARLDSSYRVGSMNIADEYFRNNGKPTYFSQFKTISDMDISDNILKLVLLFEDVNESKNWKSANLNPSFGVYSQIVGGADADLIVNDILIDIKTSATLKYDGSHFAQLFGYAAMARAIGLEVNKVAIYFARFGCFAAINIDDRILGGDKFISHFLSEITSFAK